MNIPWDKKISRVRKYFELNGKKNVAYQNFDNEVKRVLRNFVAITVILGGGHLKSIFSNKQKQSKLSRSKEKKIR